MRPYLEEIADAFRLAPELNRPRTDPARILKCPVCAVDMTMSDESAAALGELESLVMLAVMRCGEQAYGVPTDPRRPAQGVLQTATQTEGAR
jgi:hypothetical protein